MLPGTRDWLEGIRGFAAAGRAEKPLAGEGSSAARAAEKMILAAQLSAWLAGVEGILTERRAWLAKGADARGADPHPAFVITTSPSGIETAQELLGDPRGSAATLSGRTVAVTELEYRLWCIRHPDDGYARHINLWNWIKTTVPRQRHAEFARYPLAAGEDYWLHRGGIAGAGGADRRDCHLWKWNGRQASLLEAFVTERGVAELR